MREDHLTISGFAVAINHFGRSSIYCLSERMIFLKFPDRKAILFSGRACFMRSTERSGNLRNADLKDVILNKLLPQHDDTELDAEFN